MPPILHDRRAGPARTILVGLLVVFYLGGAWLHVRSTEDVMRIMPLWVPWPRAVAYLTGLWEGAAALLLLWPRTRRLGGVLLAIYAVVVFPANIRHWWEGIALFPADRTAWYHPIRLTLQPILVWAALYAGGLICWPFRR